MNSLALVKSAPFGTVNCDFWQNASNDIFMTINQLAQALGYASKSGIENMINRNEHLKDIEFSCTHKMWVGNSEQETRIFTEDGIYEVSMLSRTSIAKEFRSWVRKIIKGLRKGEVAIQPRQDKKQSALEIDAKIRNAKTRQARLLVSVAERFKDMLPKEQVQILLINATELLVDTPLLPKPEIPKSYTASDIAKLSGVSANKVGRVANKHNVKQEQYGLWVLDKSAHSDKQVRSFLYNESGKDRIIELVQQE